MQSMKDIIAKAIKEADNSYFSEDYGKQAENVIKCLQEHYAIVPLEPSEAMIQAGKEAITLGKNKPSQLVKTVFQQMVKAFKVT